MSVFGIGLGAAVDSFRKQQDTIEKKKEREWEMRRAEQRDQFAAEDQARQRELWGRQDEEYNREKATRDQIIGINKDANAAFDQAKRSGEATDQDFDSFYTNFAVPKIRQTYLEAGDIETANKFSQWAETSNARNGAKLFMRGMQKAQLGNSGGALDDFFHAAGSYTGGAYTLKKRDELVKDGKVVGYHLTIGQKDGEDIVQDVPIDQIPLLGAKFGNPQSVYEAQMKQQQDQAKADRDVDTYARKKKVDAALGLGKGGKADTSREKAIKILEKRFDGGLDGSETKFWEMPSADQEKLIKETQGVLIGGRNEEVGLGDQGENTGPQRKVIADSVTGDVLTPDQVAQQQNAAKAAAAAEKVRSSPEMKAKRDEADTKRYAAEDAEADKARYPRLIDRALKELKRGTTPDEVRQFLTETGVPEKYWPKEIER